MPDSGSETETRAVGFAQAKDGLVFRAGHQVIVVVRDLQGTRLPGSGEGASDAAEDPGGEPETVPGSASGDETEVAKGGRNLRGTVRVGDHPLKGAPFRLHKDAADGPLVTRDNLGSATTDLRWSSEHWVTGEEGKYGFTALEPGKYFIELSSQNDDGEQA